MGGHDQRSPCPSEKADGERCQTGSEGSGRDAYRPKAASRGAGSDSGDFAGTGSGLYTGEAVRTGRIFTELKMDKNRD